MKKTAFTFMMVMILVLANSCGGSPDQSKLDRAAYHHKLAYGHFFESHDGDSALQEVLESLRLDPNKPEVHMLAGLIYTGRSDLLKALTHYTQALELKPDFFEAKNNLGTVYLALGRWDKAIEVFQDLTSRDEYRTPAMGFNNLGWARYKSGQKDLALRAFVTATQLNPRLCPPHNNAGMVYLERGDLERAERSLTRGIKRCPRYAEPHLHLGRVYLKRADSERALASWQRCRALAGDSELSLRCRQLIREAGGTISDDLEEMR